MKTKTKNTKCYKETVFPPAFLPRHFPTWHKQRVNSRGVQPLARFTLEYNRNKQKLKLEAKRRKRKEKMNIMRKAVFARVTSDFSRGSPPNPQTPWKDAHVGEDFFSSFSLNPLYAISKRDRPALNLPPALARAPSTTTPHLTFAKL